MTTQINTNLLVKAIQTADRAAGSALAAARKVAVILVADHDPREDFTFERNRLLAIAKAAVGEAKLKLKHDRNVWLYIGQQLIVQMAPTAVVEIKAPSSDGKQGAVTKTAEDCTSSREVQKAVKQIREQVGMSDGRSTNAPSTQSSHEKLAKQVAGLVREDAPFLQMLRKELANVGYSVTLQRTGTRAPAKQAAKQA